MKNGKADHSIQRWQNVTSQIAFFSKGKVPNRNKASSSITPNKFHAKHVCFGGHIILSLGSLWIIQHFGSK